MDEGRHLYDSFNARYLSLKEVGESFIPNSEYYELIKNNHSLLMGPRGSGKTTLLKMLTLEGIHSWKDEPSSRKIKEAIPFWAIYIPSDIQWKRQIDYLETFLSHAPKVRDIISKQVVTINILSSVIKSFISILELYKGEFRNSYLEYDAEVSINLINEWEIRKPLPSNLSSIELALASRLKEINGVVNQIRYRNNETEEFLFENYYYYDFYDLVNNACLIFENVLKREPCFAKFAFRWALCFDELEIAPAWLQKYLFELLRSKDQRFLFKLTTSPIVSLYNEIKKEVEKIEAREEHDYKIIRIWVYNNQREREWEKFCKKLIDSRLKRKFQTPISADEILGNDNEERILQLDFGSKILEKGKNDTYSEGAIIWSVFKELAKIDPTFSAFLKQKGIDSNNPVPVFAKQRDTIFRKIKQIAIFRYQFKKEFGKRRSRKNPSIYYGLPYIYHICDGNPRAIIGLIDELLSVLQIDQKGAFKPISISEQSRIIKMAARKQLDLIKSHPDANITSRDKTINIGTLLENIGFFFHTRLIDSPFKMDAISCFIMDEEIDQKILKLMELALYLGAIVYLDPTEGLSEKGLVNKRFRLSYQLAPHFNLPNREYTPINLSKILAPERGSQHDKSGNKLHQTNLFGS